MIVAEGILNGGFELPAAKIAVITDREIYGGLRPRKPRSRAEGGARITNLSDIKPGDYVVHVQHGIGKYLGISNLEVQGARKDYLNIQYRGQDRLYVPTEQADLMQALYGRNGESPVAVIAPKSPADCFNMAYEAARIALTHMIPVMMLSDGYLANGSEPWKFPSADDIAEIPIQFQPPREDGEGEEPFLPYFRDEKQVRPWALPGTKGLEHRIGGLEKEHLTGNVSYDPDNHEKMTTIREEKREYIADNIPLQEVDEGSEDSEIAVVGWGSTFGSIRRAVHELRMEGMDVAQVHLQYISPFPKNLGELLHKFKTVIVAEINRGQLIQLLNHQLDVSAEPINKMKGRPFNVNELKDSITEIVSRKKAEEQEV